MTELHNILIRGLNSAYHHAERIKPGTQDTADLCLYSQFLCELIKAHHDWEENSFFPALEAFAGQPGIFNFNIQQHHAFEDGLQKFHEYCKQSEEKFSPQRFRDMIDEFAPSLEKHLHEEPLSFYRLRHLDSDGLSKVYLEQAKIARSKADPWV
jgi:hemerythrin-like domain-containing protein